MENNGSAVLSMTEDLQRRMLALEQGNREVLRQQGENAGTLKAIEASVKSLVESSRESKEQQAKKEKEQDEAIANLQEEQQERRGFVRAINFVWGIIGVAVGAGVKAWIQKTLR